MVKRIILAILAITLGSSAAVLAQIDLRPVTPAMSFFVATNSKGTGNLGGIFGADQLCLANARAAGGLNFNRIWRAYLSQERRGNLPVLNARDRIGEGPWYNAKGVLIASSVADLHGDQQRDRNNLQRATALDAEGNPIPGNEHDVMTGSDSQGRAFTDGLDHTCNNWTVDGMTLAQANPDVPPERARAMLGHMDRTGGQNVSWNAAHMSQGCSKQALNNTGGAGRFYCFAVE